MNANLNVFYSNWISKFGMMNMHILQFPAQQFSKLIRKTYFLKTKSAY